MIFRIVVSSLAAALAASAAGAACTDPLLTDAGISIAGTRVQASSSSDSWDEVHLGGPGGGDLCKVGLGSGHRVDPSKVVGRWTPLGGAAVNYDYGRGGAFAFELHSANGASPTPPFPVSFCQGGTEVAAGNILPGVSCP